MAESKLASRTNSGRPKPGSRLQVDFRLIGGKRALQILLKVTPLLHDVKSWAEYPALRGPRD